MSVRTIKRAALIFLPLAVAAVAVSYLLYSSQAKAIRLIAQSTEARIVDIARQRLTLTVGSIVADATYLSEQDALNSFLAKGDQESQRRLEAEYLAFVKNRRFFDQVRFIDPGGQEVVRVKRNGSDVELATSHQPQDSADRHDVEHALTLGRGQIFISEIDAKAEGGANAQSSTFRVAVPVFHATNEKRGVILINYLASRMLDRVADLREGIAGIWLLNSDGLWLLGPNEDEYPEQKETFGATYPEIWRRMQASATGQITSEFGRFSYARAEALADQTGDAGSDAPNWFVVVHTPAAFSTAQTSVLRNNFIGASAGLLFIMGGVSLGLAGHQVRRQEAEQRTRLSEARFRAVTETANDAIISADGDGIIRYFNPAAERIFGYSEDEIIGQPLIRLMPERFRQPHTEGLQRYLATRREQVIGKTVELVAQRKDGQEFPIELALASSDVDGALFFTAIVRDITVRAEAERSLRANEAEIRELNRRLQLDNAELAAVNKELEAFSYSVSHDLRAPLRAIDGFSQALIEDAGPLLSAEHHSHLNRVRQAAQRMGLLIDDLIKLARVTRSEVKIEDVDLAQIAEQVAITLQDSAPERQAEFRIAPDLNVKGDPRLLQVALENLLNNSWKFTAPRLPARIEFGRTEIDANPAFFVRDNGVGFDMAYAGKMFGAFQRFHDAREFAGTGIGLATVQRIIHKHGGRIWAESQPGSGATFFFTL